MAALLHRIIEPKTQLEESRRLFSDADIKKLIVLFSALASGGAVVVSQYIGSRDKEKAGRSASQLLMIITLLGLRVFGSGHHGALLQRETGGVLPLEVYLPLGK